MNRQDLIFRANQITNKMIRTNILNLFNRADLKNKAFIKLNINFVRENETIVLLKDLFINRTIKDEINTLIKNLIDSLNLKQISLKKGEKLVFFYIDSDADDYNSYKNSFKGLGKRFYSSIRRTSLVKRLYSTVSKNVFKFINLEYQILEGNINFSTCVTNFIKDLDSL